jgi:hypothetical protein
MSDLMNASENLVEQQEGKNEQLLQESIEEITKNYETLERRLVKRISIFD